MKFSIITASFNSQNGISNCLSSILNQNYSNFEIISIDGKSNDNTSYIINNMLRNSDKKVFEIDHGIYDALNKGIKISTGDIIGVLHSDDVYASNNILQLVADKFIETNCDVLYGDLNFIKNGKIVRQWKSNKFKLFLLKIGWMPPHPTLFIKKDVFEKYGLYNIDFKISADYDYILRIFKIKSLNFQYIPFVITNMSMGGISTSGFRNLFLKSIEDFKIIKKHNLIYPLFVLFLKISLKFPQIINFNLRKK